MVILPVGFPRVCDRGVGDAVTLGGGVKEVEEIFDNSWERWIDSENTAEQLVNELLQHHLHISVT